MYATSSSPSPKNNASSSAGCICGRRMPSRRYMLRGKFGCGSPPRRERRTAAEAAETEGVVLATLTSLAREQQALQQENDPVERFLGLLGGVLGSGRGHIACANHPDRPPSAGDARAFGWRRDHAGTWYAQGPCVGWVG